MDSNAILGLLYLLHFRYKHPFKIEDIYDILGVEWEKFFKIEGERMPLKTRTNLNLDEIERDAIIEALERSEWVQKEAAKLLGITSRSLNYKILHHKITHKSWKKYIE